MAKHLPRAGILGLQVILALAQANSSACSPLDKRPSRDKPKRARVEGQGPRIQSRHFQYMPGLGASGVFVTGETAFVTAVKGIHVYDISNVDQPKEVLIHKVEDPTDITVQKGLAYVSGGQMSSLVGHLTIVDVSDRRSLKDVGSVDLPHGCSSVAVAGDYAYVGGFDAGLFIVDCRDKKNPRFVGSVKFPRIENPKASQLKFKLLKHLFSKEARERFPFKMGRTWWNCIDGNYIYVCDENTGLHILDLSTPEKPVEVSSFIFDYMPDSKNRLAATAFNDAAVDGNLAALALDDGGIATVDVSRKSAPRLLAHFDPWKGHGWTKSPGHVAQIALRDGFAYATAGEEGVFVLDVRNPRQPRLADDVPLREDVGASWGLFLDRELLFVTYIAVDPGSSRSGLKGGWEILEILSK
jgi:hypothetical protein